MSLDKKFLEAQMIYEKTISDLEEKLADMTEKYNATNRAYWELVEKQDNDFLQYEKLIGENQQLKQQLAEKEAEIRVAYSFRKQKCDNLQKALAEKEETIEKINKEFVQAVKDWKSLVEKKNKDIVELEEHDNLYHNKLAIERLEKVKEILIQNADEIGEEYREDYFMISLGNVKNIIDNQIASLKKGVE